MTPAVKTAQKKKIKYTLHEYQHDASTDSYGMEAAEKLGVAPERVFKTLVVSLDKKSLAVCIIPVNAMLSMKKAAKAAGAKKAAMAKPDEVQRSTGYVLGGVSPLGQKKRLPTFLDISAQVAETVFVSAGRRGMDLELKPQALLEATGGSFADLEQE
ncbi:Cys-tRNA(Pro) deacylase [Desulforhopalus vacuolatus]|uniref:Cys-tRNA(Pro) deacylase n=1 Tax=Desulforhopalus vacuolatus TaxID=40414 RepID=UPI001963298C|nr:Cys-tRNA(Pro) deacylase [Desulforhopalus vacuolatus]MBM9519602.1 Cys-tRNA(Pro) deacylase [Desulforhopalus vacuolatus]